MVIIPRTLPAPDKHGTYWLDGSRTGPAIFRSKKIKVPGVVEDNNRWFASLGSKGTVLVDHYGLRYFPNPVEAMEALREAFY